MYYFTLTDHDFWLSEEPEHLMNAYLTLHPEAQDELIDFLADQREIEVKHPKDNPGQGDINNYC
jgi:hypothetical protein